LQKCSVDLPKSSAGLQKCSASPTNSEFSSEIPFQAF
jgi:hypothetical protein